MLRGTDETRAIDVNIGRVIQGKRLKLGISVENLAQTLDVTHQQLQKNIKGKNRIAASRLPILARELKLEVSDFFDEPEPSVLTSNERSVLEINKHLTGFDSAALYLVLQLVRGLGRCFAQ